MRCCRVGSPPGFYVVGSAALSAFVEGRSDVDDDTVVDGVLSQSEMRQLRRIQAHSGVERAKPGREALP
jgi:hypothetical protein